MTDVIRRFRFLFADDASIYGITADGDLFWYPSWSDTSNPPSVAAGRPIGSGWGEFVHVFAGGDGIIYAVGRGGELLWYRDDRRDGSNAADGSTGWAAASGSQIGVGWDDFSHLLAGGEGVVYAVHTGGELLWYRDLVRDGSQASDGSTGWAGASGSQIGVGWAGFRHLVGGDDGVLYAVTERGDLLWYRDDQRDGGNDPLGARGWAIGSGRRIGNGWDFFTHLFSGDAGVIYACRAAELGGTVHRYRDERRDGSNGVGGGGWDTSAATASGGWQITAIEGYCWPISVTHGETVGFHVSASTPGPATVQYVRLGGRGPRLGVPVGSGDAFDVGFESAGSWSTDCAWPVRAELEVSADAGSWEPGFYAARVRGPAGPSYDIPFVVRRGAQPAPLALIVNVNTWNAYNTWGGASNYTATASPIDLTLKRPNHHLLTYSQDHANGSHMLRSEIWLHSWLRAQGHQVDLFTDVDLDAGINDVMPYRAIVLSTHPEYWTAPMIDRLSAYLDAGGSLLYLGGNGMYRPTSLRASTDGGDIDLMTSESNQWPTYPTYDGYPLFAAAVESLGGPPTGRGLSITDPEHPFMPTGLTEGRVVGTTGWNGSPAYGASGWETDRWPAPLPAGVAELARDTSSADGSVIACYETSHGGFVLGVGSLTFVGSLMDDQVLQAIVGNALVHAITAGR